MADSSLISIGEKMKKILLLLVCLSASPAFADEPDFVCKVTSIGRIYTWQSYHVELTSRKTSGFVEVIPCEGITVLGVDKKNSGTGIFNEDKTEMLVAAGKTTHMLCFGLGLVGDFRCLIVDKLGNNMTVKIELAPAVQKIADEQLGTNPVTKTFNARSSYFRNTKAGVKSLGKYKKIQELSKTEYVGTREWVSQNKQIHFRYYFEVKVELDSKNRKIKLTEKLKNYVRVVKGKEKPLVSFDESMARENIPTISKLINKKK